MTLHWWWIPLGLLAACCVLGVVAGLLEYRRLRRRHGDTGKRKLP